MTVRIPLPDPSWHPLSLIPLILLQGKVHNPSGEGVHAVSAQAQAKVARLEAAAAAAEAQKQNHETKVKQEGSSRRNITRKKSADAANNYNSVHKKQGGHGKGQWRQDTSAAAALVEEDIPIDEKDPLYDEAEDTNKYILSSGQEEAGQVDNGDKRGYYDTTQYTSKAVYGPLLTNQEFKVRVTDALNEYFDSCDADELIRTVEEMGCQEYHHEIVKKVISVAMDKGSRERELTSRLLTCLHPYPLTLEHMERGFDLLLDSLDDLSCDVPEAKVSRDD